jgi:hypothetical protein
MGPIRPNHQKHQQNSNVWLETNCRAIWNHSEDLDAGTQQPPTTHYINQETPFSLAPLKAISHVGPTGRGTSAGRPKFTIEIHPPDDRREGRVSGVSKYDLPKLSI